MMKVCAANLMARCGLALCFLGLSAVAQETIQFSRPADSDTSGKANGFIPGNHNAATAYNAPPALLGGQGSSANFDVLPGSPRTMLSPAQAAQLQKILEDRKNWALMTPEEILGISTPEKIMGVVDPEDDPQISQEERYLRRRDREIMFSATNHAAVVAEDASPLGPDTVATSVFASASEGSPFIEKSANSQSGPGSSARAFVKKPSSLAGMNQGTDETWESPFASAPPIPEQTPEQLAGMERFRQLMEPETLAKAAAPTAFGSSPGGASPVDPNFEREPVINPAGTMAVELRDTMVRPVGLTPLGAAAQLPTAPKPAPLVQPPPWLSTGPGNIMPQRTF